MPLTSHAELPDPEVARQEIRDAFSELGPVLAKQARAHAEAVRRFLERRELRGTEGREEALRLLMDIADQTTGSRSSWQLRVGLALRGSFDTVTGSVGIYEAINPVGGEVYTLRHYMEGGPASRHQQQVWTNKMRALLADLHPRLITLANSLARSFPAPLLPVRHPPKFARLQEGAFVEEVTEKLAACIDEGLRLYASARRSGWPGPQREKGPNGRWDLVFDGRFPTVLSSFQQYEVFGGYTDAIEGFENIGALEFQEGGLWDPQAFPEDRAIADRIVRRVYCGYAAIAVNYLAEVQELMPRYLGLSEQGKRRDGVTIYGNVGALNSEVNNSNLSVADTINSIGRTIEAVADHGHADIAAAIRALTEAVQQASELAEDQRAALLDSVADVADAAVAPDEPRRLNRARNAMAAITAAAGTSSQLAQAVDAWHQIGGHLF
ncbi:hypothetical protein ABZW32_14855 [Streptomyces sp. NPDC004667]|uniref:hypothetical protein n=1 Tax=Streptomyces sp. NPDC004667 TaxID=3154285 RepID=UPI0033ABC253